MSEFTETKLVNNIFSAQHTKGTLIATVVASLTALICAYFGMTTWYMFIGWVAYFMRPTSFVNMLSTGLCVSLGIILAVLAASGIGLLMPTLGILSFSVIVFIVAVIVLTLRSLPIIGNPLAWFLGLITYFAAHIEPSLYNLAPMIATIYLGALAGFVTYKIQIKE